METSPQEKRVAALKFLQSNEVGALATISVENKPRVRTLYYVAGDDFSVYFLTFANTRKAEDLAAHAFAALAVSDTDAPATLQMEGTISDETPNAEIDENVKKLLEIILKKGEHFAPLTRLDATRVTFFKFTPTWIRWGDFTVGEGTDEVLTTIH